MYIRLLFSSFISDKPAPPQPCMRFVNGTADYQLFGWFVTKRNVGYLIPITIINLTSLALFITALTNLKILTPFITALTALTSLALFIAGRFNLKRLAP